MSTNQWFYAGTIMPLVRQSATLFLLPRRGVFVVTCIILNPQSLPIPHVNMRAMSHQTVD